MIHGKPIKDEMAFTRTEPKELIEPPSEIIPQNVMYWEPTSKELMRLKADGSTEATTILDKALTFLENDCIKKVTNWTYYCGPIKGYNKTTYTIQIGNVSGELSCNCQGFAKKFKETTEGWCSHCQAVTQYMFMNDYNKKDLNKLNNKKT